MYGLLLFHKPRGWRNRETIAFLRRLSGEQRVGHGGTLDPAAEGLLVVGLGRTATRALAPFLNQSQKTYQATLRLGARSTTGDAEGELTEVVGAIFPTREQIEALLAEQFSGERLQQPPIFSALKIHGRRARDLAVKGQPVELAPRLVCLYGWRLISFNWPELQLELSVSSGFYVRSLAMALGEALGSGAYLTALIRTEIVCNGVSYRLDRALGPDDFDGAFELSGRIVGAVQGVGFRALVQSAARELNLNGWVENLTDGSVAVCAQGQRSQLEQFQQTIELGSAPSWPKRSGQIEQINFLWQRQTLLLQRFIIK